jgi:hypothetical protein
MAQPSGLDDRSEGEYNIKAGGEGPRSRGASGRLRLARFARAHPRGIDLQTLGAVLEVAENAVFSYGASAFQPPRNMFSLQRELRVVSESTYFAARRFLLLGVLLDRSEGAGDSDSFFFPPWTLV